MLSPLPLGWRFDAPLDQLHTPSHDFPRGRISEISGPRFSGRTALLHDVLAASTSHGECAALIDACDAFDPCSAEAVGVKLQKLLWVRCKSNAEHALRAADLLIQAGGFGVVALDLIEARGSELARIPATAWFRFRRAVEPTPTVLLVVADKPLAKSCAAKRVMLERRKPVFTGQHPFQLLQNAGSSEFQRTTQAGAAGFVDLIDRRAPARAAVR